MKKFLLILFLSTNYVFASSGSYLLWENYFFTLNNNIITIPEYIATYMIAIGGYFFTIIIIFELIMTSYKYISAGFNFQQIRPVILNMISTIFIVIALVYTPGLKTTTSTDNGEIRTKLIVDIVSAFLASGSRIADVFSYELLFGNGYPIPAQIFQPTFAGPTSGTALNGFILNTFSSSVYSTNATMKENFQNFNNNVNNFIENQKTLTDPTLLSEYKDNYDSIDKAIKIFENATYSNTNINSDNTENYSNNFRMNDGDVEITVPFTTAATPDEVVKVNASLNEKVQEAVSSEIQDTLIDPVNKFYDMLDKDIDTGFNNDYVLKNKTIEIARLKNILKQQKDKFNTIPLISSVINGGDSPENFKTLFQDSFTGTTGNDNGMNKNEKNISKAIQKNQTDTLKLLQTAIKTIQDDNGMKQKIDEFMTINFSKRITDTYIDNKKEIAKLNEEVKFLSTYRTEVENKIGEVNAAMEQAKNSNKTSTSQIKTLNDLYKKSNFLNNLEIFTFMFDDFEVQSIVETMNLASDYEFHWFDLGKYFLGIKSIMSDNLLKQMAYNNMTVSLENDDDVAEFLFCSSSKTVSCKNSTVLNVENTEKIWLVQ